MTARCVLPADWLSMWTLAGMIFASCKWLTWWAAPRGASLALQLGYLFAWPGMDVAAFLFTSSQREPRLGDWLFALAKVGLGAALLWGAFPRVPMDYEWARGWVGMIGVIFVLHFGLFHLLSLAWQALGVNAKPLMNWPVLATSVSEFWGQRWNIAFRDLTHRFLFRPLTARLGPKIALFVGFFFSGIVHDLIISVPAHGGYGGPTTFFVIQAIAIFVERSTMGRRLGLGRGLRGWAFTMAVLIGPIVLLFHDPFVCGVVVPFLDWLTEYRP